MKRNSDARASLSAAARCFDVVVVGDSIAGLAAARVFCQRGMTVARVERDATRAP